MTFQNIVLSFHGCDAALAKRVAAGDEDLRPSRNAYDWLGHGLYFWQDSPARARAWAGAAVKRENTSVKKPGVLGAVIDLGNCLSLTDPQAIHSVRDAHRRYSELAALANVKPARNLGTEMSARFLDCAVFEMLHTMSQSEGRAPYDTVRAFFVEGSEIYPGAGIREQDHVQICVRNPKRILGFFLPRLG